MTDKSHQELNLGLLLAIGRTPTRVHGIFGTVRGDRGGKLSRKKIQRC